MLRENVKRVIDECVIDKNVQRSNFNSGCLDGQKDGQLGRDLDPDFEKWFFLDTESRSNNLEQSSGM
jgi:hypothetical protein